MAESCFITPEDFACHALIPLPPWQWQNPFRRGCMHSHQSGWETEWQNCWAQTSIGEATTATSKLICWRSQHIFFPQKRKKNLKPAEMKACSQKALQHCLQSGTEPNNESVETRYPSHSGAFWQTVQPFAFLWIPTLMIVLLKTWAISKFYKSPQTE